VERRILAGFLRPEEVGVVYPASREWPADVAERVRVLHGAATGLAPRPDAGCCLISPVEEPEALTVLDPIARSMQLPPAVTVSFAWVEISNLIATASVADPMPEDTPLSNEDLKGLAEYSLYEVAGQPMVAGGSLLINSAPLEVVFTGVRIVGNQFIVRYQLIRSISPIIVGYDEGHCYLLTDYGRVVHAINQNIKRLLCIVYYGLDHDKADFGVKFPGQEGAALNHFGKARISVEAPPLVRDFLDPTVGATIPAKGTFFSAQPAIQAILMKYDSPPEGQIPLPSEKG
jgi:hypothetical protein